ncbi:hypothetical protein C0431_10865 [bacterium]|nr:hypothetical protein [bacterium]
MHFPKIVRSALAGFEISIHLFMASMPIDLASTNPIPTDERLGHRLLIEGFVSQSFGFFCSKIVISGIVLLDDKRIGDMRVRSTRWMRLQGCWD